MSVTVRYGVNSLTLDHLAGRNVREVRGQVEALLHVPEQAQARLNGQPVSEETCVSEGAALEFVKAHGEKGAA